MVVYDDHCGSMSYGMTETWNNSERGAVRQTCGTDHAARRTLSEISRTTRSKTHESCSRSETTSFLAELSKLRHLQRDMPS